MYGWSFGIQDNATASLTGIASALQTTTVKASALIVGLGSVSAATRGVNLSLPNTAIAPQSTSVSGAIGGTSSTTVVNMDGAAESATTLGERVTNIATAALNVQRAFDFMKLPLQALHGHVEVFKESLVGVSAAIKEGNWSAAAESFSYGLSESMTMVNEFRTSWTFVKEGFESSKLIFGETWTVIKTGALQSVGFIKTIGTTFLMETLPSVLTFVGSSVISFAGYIASLVGATGAQAALNAMMLANPIGIIIVGIAAVGAAVYGLITYWDEVKTFLVDMGKTMWAMNPFSWMIDLTKVVFPEFYKGVEEWFGKAFSFIDNTLITPVKDFFGWLTTAPEKVMAVSQEVTDSYKTLFGVGANNPFGNLKSNLTLVGSPAMDAEKKEKSLGIKERMNEVKGSDKKINNINIRIDKLIEKVENNFGSGNQYDARKVQEEIGRALLSAMNDFNYQ